MRAPSLNSLAGMRFVATALIGLHHFGNVIDVPASVRPFVEHARAGVSLFFMLSGFLLVYRYLEWFAKDLGRLRAYSVARVARVVPLHVLTLLLMTPITLLIGGYVIPTDWLVQSWLANLFLLHAYEALGRFHIWNVPSWSISALLSFYAVFPFFARFLLAGITRLRSLVILAALVYGVEIVTFAWAIRSFLRRGPSPDIYALDRFLWSPFLRIWEFLLGCILGAIFLALLRQPTSRLAMLLKRAAVRNGILALVLAGLAGLALLLESYRLPALADLRWTPYVLFAPLFFALIGVMAAGPTFVSRLLCHPWVARLDQASYAFYLIHWLPLLFLIRLTEAGAPPPWPLVLLVAAATVVVSLLCYRYVEQPANAWVRRLAPRPTPAGRPEVDRGETAR